MSPLKRYFRTAIGKAVKQVYKRRLQRFVKQLHDVRRIQRGLLAEKVRRCAESRYGCDHGFKEIKTLADFRRHVPIAGYDYYFPYVKQLADGNGGALLPPDDKLLMFTLSSGTTGEPKLIPVTQRWMDEFRRGWQLWGVKVFLDHALSFPKMVSIIGHWDMRRTPSGVPCGMASGLSARCQSRLLRSLYAVPSCVFEIEDVDAKYYTALRLAIPESVRFFSTATASTAVKFARLGNKYRELLIRDIAGGTLSERFDIPPAVRKRLAQKISVPRPERAQELECIVRTTGSLYPKDYWNLSLLSCWLGGTAGALGTPLLGDFYGNVPRRDIGLIASEGRMTIPLEDETPSGVLDITSHYYEFVPEEEMDSPQPTVLECDELVESRNYFILLTTSSGLYRYHIGDVVRCTGYLGQAPLLEFLNKGQHFSDMEGEKITEHHMLEAVFGAAQRIGLSISAFSAVPVRPTNGPPYYVILIEEQDLREDNIAHRFLRAVDHWLTEHNIMYATKRADTYLGPPRLRRIPAGSWARYAQREIARRKVSEDQFKHPCLVPDETFSNQFRTVSEVCDTRIEAQQRHSIRAPGVARLSFSSREAVSPACCCGPGTGTPALSRDSASHEKHIQEGTT